MESAETFDSPGKYLKAKRESQKLSLKEVADTTRIREPVLRALEEDRYANLPAIYVRSFLSTYAECLGLDSNEVIMVHQKIAEKRSFSNGQVLKPPSTIQKNGVNGRLLVISISVVLLMALIVYASFELLAKFSFFSDRRKQAFLIIFGPILFSSNHAERDCKG